MSFCFLPKTVQENRPATYKFPEMPVDCNLLKINVLLKISKKVIVN
jgi:hypothetical protein